MPRTKHTRKSKQMRDSVEETDLLVKDFERQAQLRIMKMDAEAKMAIKGLVTFVDLTVSMLPSEIQQITLGELIAWQSDDQKENDHEVSSSNVPTTVKSKKISKRITTISDDGYVTESATAATTRASRMTKRSTEPRSVRRTRSTSSSSRAKIRKPNFEIGTTGKTNIHREESLKRDRFKTPAVLKPLNNEFGIVTPKVKPNTPMNVLRRPRQGEMVLSMQGSPLLVSAVVQERTANINVPLSNGNVMSLLPNDGLRMSHIPSLDPETMRQLETLKSHIEKVIATK